MSQDNSRLSRRSLLAGGGMLAALQFAGGETSPRIRESFDFDWKFLKGDAPGAHQPGFADSDWRTLDVPHDWSIEGPFSQDERAQGNLPAGIGWYRKRFRMPDSWRERVVSIEFDGVYENSEVWINGHYLGKRPFGYVNFSYDLTPHLRPGAENVIAVKVDNSKQRNSRWYSGSGMYRHVWLVATDRLHVNYLGTFVTTPGVGQESATVQVKTRSATRAPAPHRAPWPPPCSTAATTP